MGPLSDDELVAAAQSGDRNALDQLLRRHYDGVYAVCRRITGGTADADDACQEALIKISRSITRFDGRSQFGTWAYRIATNAALDELRRRKRRPALHSVLRNGRHAERFESGSVQPDPVDPLASKSIDAVADRLAIDEALAELAEDFRVAVILRDVVDLDYGEIADVLDIPLGTVKSRIARGRAVLADHLRIDELLTTDMSGEFSGDVPVELAGDLTGVTEQSVRRGNRSGDPERPTDRS